MQNDDYQNLPVDPATLPRTAGQEYHGLAPAYKYARLMGLILWGGGILTAMVVVGLFNQIWQYPGYVAGGIAAWLTLLLLRVWILFRGFRRKKYALRERDVTYQRGLITFAVTSIPFNRVQHAEVNQGFIDRMFELAKLSIYTAGGSSSDLVIPGLNPDEAQRLKDFILKQSHAQSSSSD